MGSGKSCVGRALAELLHVPFVDLDEYIETKAGMTIPEIFDADGEESFRAIETEALGEVLAGAGPDRDMVLALGGGAVIREENARMIARKCKCVFLRASAATLRGRLEGGAAGRPMLRDGGFERLLTARMPAYERSADLTIDTDGLTPGRIAGEIAANI